MRGLRSDRPSPRRVRSGANEPFTSGVWLVTNLSVCLFVCQQVACDVTVYSRSESPCHVSLSVKSVLIVRSTGRSISHNSLVNFLDQSVCVCRCLYKERNTRPRALTSAVRCPLPLPFFSSSSFHSFNLSRAPKIYNTAYPKSRNRSSRASRDRTERYD